MCNRLGSRWCSLGIGFFIPQSLVWFWRFRERFRRVEMSKQSFVGLAEKFLAMMRDERGASEHTLRAYAREVRGFAEFLASEVKSGKIADVEHLHIRAYLAMLYD